jgi:hypothetical protein
MKVIPPDFIQIPCQLLADKKLQPLDRIVYGFIYWFAKLKNEKCTAGNETLANLCGVKAQSIKNSLVRLEKTAYIERIFFDEKRRKRSEIIPLITFGRVYSNKYSVASNEYSGYPHMSTRIRAVNKKTIKGDLFKKFQEAETQSIKTMEKSELIKQQLRKRWSR